MQQYRLDRVTEKQIGRRGPECPAGHEVKHEQVIPPWCKRESIAPWPVIGKLLPVGQEK